MKIGQQYPAHRHPSPRELKLEQELESARGTLMYCEAADFQSAEERETASEMRRKMHSLNTELAQLRGDGVLCDQSIDDYLAAVRDQNPLGRLKLGALAAHLPVFTGATADAVAEIRSGLIHKTFSDEEFEARLDSRALNAEAKPDDPEVRRQAAEILRKEIPREGPDLFGSLEQVLTTVEGAASDPLTRGVLELARGGQVELTAGDFNFGGWQCIYQAGDLGHWAGRLSTEESPHRRSRLADRMGTMLDLPGVEIPSSERETAGSALRNHLQTRLESISQLTHQGLRQAQLDRFSQELELWAARGVKVENLQDLVRQAEPDWNLAG